MGKHSHRFVDDYDGLIGFGFEREVDEYTITYYLQKFSDDNLMAVIRERMSDEDMAALFDLITRIIKKYLSEEEYHLYFLKDKHPE